MMSGAMTSFVSRCQLKWNDYQMYHSIVVFIESRLTLLKILNQIGVYLRVPIIVILLIYLYFDHWML